ncbi:DUF6221 family protein [Streptomyces sp. A0592]|uniref:DUF6221 family protein n=1 Tax=Streptomyces sp. A0592 TaxID=2563099 RepID=UPI00109E5AC1|nr:DUF6221 family protein [Streptomyces sp. A0592]THA82739.1 hypothetical protein E6U81_19545 [Streptomyces sp. A0592]
MDDLVQFLRARLDEDEQAARAATGGPWVLDDERHAEQILTADESVVVVGGSRWSGEAPVFETTADGLHIARHDPARVLAEVDAKRRILLLHNIPAVVSPKMAALGLREGEAPEDDRRCAGCGLDNMDDPITPDVNACPILRALALPYAGHDDFKEEWRG